MGKPTAKEMIERASVSSAIVDRMQTYRQCDVTVRADYADLASQVLFELGSTGTEVEEQGQAVTFRAYFPEPASEFLAQRIEEELRELGCPQPTIVTRTLAAENWAETWRDWFTPVAAGQRLWVQPPWTTHAPPGRLKIVIEPGMAFGTGHHASTLGCLELLEVVLERCPVRTALDLGTGSGILAIALAKLGAAQVYAVDIDRTALHVARENVFGNQVADVVSVGEDWALPGVVYDCIVANLYRNALVELAAPITTHLAAGGSFVCAGFLRPDEAEIVSTYTLRGVSLEQRWERDGWVALLFHNPVR
ncbi:MAG: 50S ribosomal protein L11 methyltransferase [Candidatus Binatia bacterium]|nr:50S ribosomal protein L11 methyltransferase [Candidatus Binatia bacterium]